MNPPLAFENLKIKWKIHFLTFLNTDQNARKKNLEWKYEHSFFKSTFGIIFSTLGSSQTENTQMRVFTSFQFDHFPKSKIDFESRFEMRMSIFLV